MRCGTVIIEQSSDYFSINATAPLPPCRFQEPPSSRQAWGSRLLLPSGPVGLPVDAFCLCPTLPPSPLTGRGCHGPSGPCYGRPGEHTRTTTFCRFIYFIISRPRLPSTFQSIHALHLSFLSLFGPVQSVLYSPCSRRLTQLARLQACTYTHTHTTTDSHSLSRDTRRGLVQILS